MSGPAERVGGQPAGCVVGGRVLVSGDPGLGASCSPHHGEVKWPPQPWGKVQLPSLAPRALQARSEATFVFVLVEV